MPADRPRPAVRVAVVMERETAPNRWEDWRFRIVEVVPHEDAFGLEARVLRDDGKRAAHACIRASPSSCSATRPRATTST